MNQQTNRHGKREVGSGSLWGQYRDWLDSMSRGQRIRYRLLQGATMVSIVIIGVFLFLSAWIKVPELPDFGGDSSTGGVPGGPTQIGGSGTPSSGGDPLFDGAEVPDIIKSGRKNGVYTFLLVGRDVVSGSTDTILLLSYDINQKTIRGLNLPRDTMMNVSTASKRLNAVFGYNRGRDKETRTEKGINALRLQVSKLTGITPDFYVLVEWEAIGNLVNALGGVEFEVPWDMNYDDPEQNLHIHQKAGLRKLNGEDAMQVIRWRKNNDGSNSSGGDLARLGIQQNFLKAAAKECLQPAIFLNIPELARIFTENVETDLTLGNILAFAQLAYGMDPEEDVSFVTAPVASSVSYNGASMVVLSGNGILEIVNSGMNPYQRDIQSSDLELIYRNKNGSFGVTKGSLADSRMGQVPVRPADASSNDENDSETPINPEDSSGDQTGAGTGQGSQTGAGTGQGSQTGAGTGQDSQTGTGSGQGGQTGTGDHGNSGSGEGDPGASQNPSGGSQDVGTIDPGKVFPDPSPSSQDIRPGQEEENKPSKPSQNDPPRGISQDIRMNRNAGAAVLPSRPVPVEVT